MATLSQEFDTFCNDPERKALRSISWFKTHLSKASTITLKNKTGSKDFTVLASGERGFTIEMNNQPHYIQYPRAGYMKLTDPGNLQFLKGFNGEVVMECRIKTYVDGSEAPSFEEYPPEESEYGRKKSARRKVATAA